MLNHLVVIAGVFFVIISGCKEEPLTFPKGITVTVSTDKAAYAPNEPVSFTINRELPPTARIRYKYLGEVIEEVAFSGKSWTWNPPATDFRGYMVELYSLERGTNHIHGAIAVDVSSDWTRFPRYGFLSRFSASEPIQGTLDNLKRHHINGLQFYDWHYKHHDPLAGTGTQPAATWKDIINRDIYFSTVEGYISAAHARNIKTMFYNLAYGATNTAEADGVQPEWFLYKDNQHNTRDQHSLPQPPFNSNIYLTHPGLSAWQQYLIDKNQEVYAALDFDGFHIDQLGNRGSVYDYDGNPVILRQTFRPFIEAMKAAHPDKQLAFNSVDKYAQGDLAQSRVDFLYNEVWSDDTYEDLARIIRNNNTFSNNTLQTVLAAYMNYDLADNPGTFNTPAVLLTDAVIFAFGGAHLELGEHMLGKEYFPNDNLKMDAELQEALVSYYDFLTAYQNLLRDGGTFNDPDLKALEFGLTLSNWPAQAGQIAVIGKKVGNRQVLHLLNFTNLSSLDWRDSQGTKVRPTVFEALNLQFSTTQEVRKVWFASPDIKSGASQELSLAIAPGEDQVTFSIPGLEIWSMVVVEY